MDISCSGITGHGSLLPDGTAAEKIRFIIDKFLNFRESEKNRLLENPNLTLGDVTTVNLMALEVFLIIILLSEFLWHIDS